MKQILSLCAAALTLTLTACGKKDVEAVLPAGTVGLRITSEVPIGVTADRISVMPNDVAPWLSQILVLADGQLYRTSTNGSQAERVNGGSLKDMAGLMRKGQPGTVLTLTTDGNLTALIEKDDEGRLARMNVSSKAKRYDSFCQNDKAPTDTVVAISGKSLISLNISYEGNELMSVEEIGKTSLPKTISTCFVAGETVYAIAGSQLYVGGQANIKIAGDVRNLSGIAGESTSTLLYIEGSNTLRSPTPSTRRKVIIQDGLSVMGTEDVSSVFVTADSLGGTFSDGAVIAQDAKTERLILVSRSFARRAL